MARTSELGSRAVEQLAGGWASIMSTIPRRVLSRTAGACWTRKAREMMADTQPHGRPALKLTSKWTPAFTADDMKAYLQGAPECSLGPTLSGEPPIVEAVEFVTSKELTDRLKVYIA